MKHTPLTRFVKMGKMIVIISEVLSMGIWYQVEKTQKGIDDFLDCNWGFHDFRIERVVYISRQDVAEVFLKYDTDVEGVLLRFSGLYGINLNVDVDYEADWLYDTSLLLRANNNLLWVATDNVLETDKDFQDVLKCITWVEASQLIWAVTNGNGIPVEMPASRLNQVWNSYGKETKRHFAFCECDG